MARSFSYSVSIFSFDLRSRQDRDLEEAQDVTYIKTSMKQSMNACKALSLGNVMCKQHSLMRVHPWSGAGHPKCFPNTGSTPHKRKVRQSGQAWPPDSWQHIGSMLSKCRLRLSQDEVSEPVEEKLMLCTCLMDKTRTRTAFLAMPIRPHLLLLGMSRSRSPPACHRQVAMVTIRARWRVTGLRRKLDGE